MARGAALAPVLLGAAALAMGAGPAGAADRDCADFDTQRQAQRYFLAKGGPGRDPDNLDSDGDGIACESNPCPCQYGGGEGGGGGERPQRIRARVTAVVDGDTLRVRAFGARRSRYSVRLIGIDTPEKYGGAECGARRASAAMRRRAPRGTRVRLITDPGQDTFDAYGRLLAYVERRRDGRDLGRAQLTAGWAKVYVFSRPFRRVRGYRRAARAARRADRGVWGRCGGHFHQPL